MNSYCQWQHEIKTCKTERHARHENMQNNVRIYLNDSTDCKKSTTRVTDVMRSIFMLNQSVILAPNIPAYPKPYNTGQRVCFVSFVQRTFVLMVTYITKYNILPGYDNP